MARTLSNNNNDEADANNNDEGEVRGGSLKKGPWTPAEDAILVEYVNKFGEGNWNSVQKNSGLSRCGKSCRLRWANHLRPNLKKGAFSHEEEQIIIDLHAKIGNKWARMASQLPGRTDNEIKNFWNTRMKRRQRAGLPLYPPEVHAEGTAYHLQQQQQQHQHLKQPPFSNSNSSSSSFFLLLSSCYPKKLINDPNNQNHFAINSLQNQPAHSYNTSQHQHQFKFPNENNSASPYGSSSSTLFNQSFAPQSFSAGTDSLDHQSFGHHGFIPGGSPYEAIPIVPGSNNEISSSQTPATPDSSYASGVDGLMGASSIANNNNNTNDYYEVAPLFPQGNSGLLDALVMEAQGLSHNDKTKSTSNEDTNLSGKLSHKRKNMEEVGNAPVVSAMKNSDNTSTDETPRDDVSSFQLSKGKKVIGDEDPLEEMNSMDDDLFSLLNHFPSEMPMPEWYRRGESQSLGLETQPDALPPPGPTDQEFAWTLGTCWNNMPGIC